MLEEIKTFVETSRNLISLLQDVTKMIPEEEQKVEIESRINDAKRELAIAEAATAKDLGYDLCQCTFPPQIMLFTGQEKIFKCPSCGHEIDNSLTCGVNYGKRKFDGFI